jgi:hypothetical protein
MQKETRPANMLAITVLITIWRESEQSIVIDDPQRHRSKKRTSESEKEK